MSSGQAAARMRLLLAMLAILMLPSAHAFAGEGEALPPCTEHGYLGGALLAAEHRHDPKPAEPEPTRGARGFGPRTSGFGSSLGPQRSDETVERFGGSSSEFGDGGMPAFNEVAEAERQ